MIGRAARTASYPRPVSDLSGVHPAMPQRKPHIRGASGRTECLCLFGRRAAGRGRPDGLAGRATAISILQCRPSWISRATGEISRSLQEMGAPPSDRTAWQSRGDLIFTHHRLLHGPSVNRSTAIRYAFLCDYKRDRFAEMCREASTADIWADWPTIAALPAKMRDGASDYELQRKAPREQRAAPGSQAGSVEEARFGQIERSPA